jgi:hypothetical protein
MWRVFSLMHLFAVLALAEKSEPIWRVMKKAKLSLCQSGKMLSKV